MSIQQTGDSAIQQPSRQPADSAIGQSDSVIRQSDSAISQFAGGAIPQAVDGAARRSGGGVVDLGEAARQLELAIHDARVAFDCIALEDLDRAHTFVITARAATDAAENIVRASLGARTVIAPDI